MSNPVLNERTIEKWAAPDAAQRAGVNDGPVSEWSSPPAPGESMTVKGSVSATAVLIVLLLISAAYGWYQTGSPTVDSQGVVQYGIPSLAMVGVFVGLGLAFLMAFKPHLARFVAPVYALAQGVFVGSVSRAYEEFYDGIVIQAAGATIAVTAVMLGMYLTGVIRVTDRFRRIVISATLGLMVFYLISWVISLFGANVSFLSSSSPMSIGFSVIVVGLAAMNLALDFDFIERGSQAGLPKHFEWFAAFGLLVTLVWLYLELLRLLAKLRDR